MSKHTPGPWSVDADNPLKVVGAEGEFIADCDGLHGDPSDADRARFIAAAPELLEALKRLTASVPHTLKAGDTFNQAWRDARAAIAKAEGTAEPTSPVSKGE